MIDRTIVERYRQVYTGVVSDALDSLGLRYQTLPCDLLSLRETDRIVGPAYTVRGRPSDEKDTAKRIGPSALERAPAGSIVCYDANGDTRAGIWGELWTAASVARGIAGAVVDGAVRDVARMADYSFPIFFRHKRPSDSIGRFTVVEAGGEVELAGVRVAPGDMVVGDSDGIVIVPSAVVLEVLEIAEARVADESKMRVMLDSGMDAKAVYDKFDHF